MSKPIYRHTIHALRGDSKSITCAARTTSLSFDNDQLITWLRPGAPKWGTLDPVTMKWQYRRFQTERWDAVIVRAATKMCSSSDARPSKDGPGASLTAKNGLSTYGAISKTEAQVQETTSLLPDEETGVESAGAENEDEDYSGVAILIPPKQNEPSLLSRAGVSRALAHMWHGVLERISPADDPGSDGDRIEMMMAEHDAKTTKYALQFRALEKKAWYLEVCCVRPCMQGRGTARALMEWVLETVGGDACYLECTEESNVAFYRKFGFEVFETVRLSHRGEEVVLWMMLRG